MAHTLRDITAIFRGASVTLKGNITSPPRPELLLSTSADLSCQGLDELQRCIFQTLGASIVRMVETASLLHSAAGGTTVSLTHGDLAGQAYYAVSINPERSLELPSAPSGAQLFAFVLNNLCLLLRPERALGTWANTDKGTHVLDVVVCP